MSSEWKYILTAVGVVVVILAVILSAVIGLAILGSDRFDEMSKQDAIQKACLISQMAEGGTSLVKFKTDGLLFRVFANYDLDNGECRYRISPEWP